MMIDPILFRFSCLAARKTVRENLIKDLIGHPLRAAIRQIDGELFQSRRRKTVKALRREPALTIRPQQLKTVAPTRLAAGKIDFAPPRHDARMRLPGAVGASAARALHYLLPHATSPAAADRRR